MLAVPLSLFKHKLTLRTREKQTTQFKFTEFCAFDSLWGGLYPTVAGHANGREWAKERLNQAGNGNRTRFCGKSGCGCAAPPKTKGESGLILRHQNNRGSGRVGRTPHQPGRRIDLVAHFRIRAIENERARMNPFSICCLPTRFIINFAPRLYDGHHHHSAPL